MGESLSNPDGGGAPCGRLTCRAPDAPEREDAADEGPRRLPVKARRGGRRVLKPSASRRRLFPISRPARCLVGGCAQGFSNAERPHRVPSVSDSHVGGHGTASGAACQRVGGAGAGESPWLLGQPLPGRRRESQDEAQERAAEEGAFVLSSEGAWTVSRVCAILFAAGYLTAARLSGCAFGKVDIWPGRQRCVVGAHETFR